MPLQESPALHKFYQVYGGINSDILQEDLFHSQVCCTQSPCRCGRPLLTRTSAGNTQTLKGRSGSVSMGSPGAHKVLFKPSECLWRAWGLILNAISPPPPPPTILLRLLLTLDVGYLFFGGILHFPVDGCSVSPCSFGVLAGEDESMSFYSTILYLLSIVCQALL